MQSRKATIFLLIFFFIGLSVLLYPSISSYWNSKTQSEAIVDYEAMLAAYKPEDYTEIFQKADDYNSSLAAMTAPSAVRLIDNLVTCGNNALDARRGLLWCYGPTITQHIGGVPLAVHVARRVCVLLHLLLLRTPEQHKQHHRKQ